MLLSFASRENHALSSIAMKSLCDTKPCCPARFWRIGMSSFGLSVRIIDTIHAQLALHPLGCPPPFLRHGFNIAHICESLDLLEIVAHKRIHHQKCLAWKWSQLVLWKSHPLKVPNGRITDINLLNGAFPKSLQILFFVGFLEVFCFFEFSHGFSPKESSNIVFCFQLVLIVCTATTHKTS